MISYIQPFEDDGDKHTARTTVNTILSVTEKLVEGEGFEPTTSRL